MQHSSSDLLEFDALRELLARYVSSPPGRARLELVAPSSDLAVIEPALAEVREAIDYLHEGLQPKSAARDGAWQIRFDSLPDPSLHVQKLRIEGAGLEGTEIAELLSFLDRAASIRAILQETGGRFPRLSARAESLGDYHKLLSELSGKILPDGTLDDHASVALNRLRRDIEKQQKQISESLERFLRAHREEGVLQEDFVTIRNDRFVVPVIAGQKRRIDGVIHGASASGHTLFVEPLETIHLNNDLVRLREEEQREVWRILREMTEKLRAHWQSIAATVETMAGLDLLFGKARFGLDFRCVIPSFSPENERRLLLEDARHPLLEDVLKRRRKRVVPASLTLDRDTRTLLISGPNTGGKTVTLKTVGLLALMAHAGLPVPATRAEFPLFDQVLADIGDQQSIQESLSTFSAHITRIREMSLDVTAESLILLDEIGRATDPEEGGALGVAILANFKSTGAMTLASTHLLALKIWGASNPGVLNGSVGFNEETLEPTYVLRLGAPGKSAALEIASRIGLPHTLIDRARANMTTGERDIARFLGELHQKLESVGTLERELAARRAELETRERELAREWEKRESAKIRELEKRCQMLVEKFETQARETIEQIEQAAQQRKAADRARLEVAKTRREFQQEVRAAVTPSSASAKPELRIEPGVRVRLEGIRQPARVRRVLSDGLIEVDAGLMKMQVAAADVVEVLPDAAADQPRLPKNVTVQTGPAWNVSYREVNVIGKRAEEAVEEVDKFLDQAALASVDRVRIVHGFGMGVLKRAMGTLLAHHPHVEKFYSASQGEGGGGATIVELKV